MRPPTHRRGPTRRKHRFTSDSRSCTTFMDFQYKNCKTPKHLEYRAWNRKQPKRRKRRTAAVCSTNSKALEGGKETTQDDGNTAVIIVLGNDMSTFIAYDVTTTSLCVNIDYRFEQRLHPTRYYAIRPLRNRIASSKSGTALAESLLL